MDSDHVDNVLADWAREWPELDASPQAVIGRLSRLTRFFERDLVGVFEQFQLNGGGFDVLATLRRNSARALTQTELAAACMLSSAAMTNRIDQLDNSGLIERVRSSVDRRLVSVLLTRRGKEVIDRVLVVHMTNESEMLKALTAAEKETLAQLLKKLLLPRENQPAVSAPSVAVGNAGSAEAGGSHSNHSSVQPLASRLPI